MKERMMGTNRVWSGWFYGRCERTGRREEGGGGSST